MGFSLGPGKDLLHYRILKQLGVGGQGQVYLATNLQLGRSVVIKVLPPGLTQSEVNLKRFQREARLASSLDHPNICAIYDLAHADGLHFIVMQHVEGSNVRELVHGRPLELKTALSIAIQVCDALTAAHARGIIHRDIKANNIMVTPSGQVRVLDFGLAKLLDDGGAAEHDIHQTHLTEIGVPYGTATYAAPEQAQGLRADARADIFSTGVLLYEMLTGTWPFRGKTTIDVRYGVLHDTPEPIATARPTLPPPRLQEIVNQAMAKRPEDRYQSIARMRDDLSEVFHDLSVTEDPNFREAHVPIAPRRLAKSFSPLERLSSLTGLSKRATQVAGFALVALMVFALAALVGLRARSSIANRNNLVLRLHGSNTIGARLAPALVEEFLRKQGATGVRTVSGSTAEELMIVGTLPGNVSDTVIEIKSHGSATAFEDLLKGQTDIGLSSRKIKPQELQSLAKLGDLSSPGSEHVLALDGIAVIVNRENSIDTLTRDQIRRIFSGEIVDWSAVGGQSGPIKIYARDDKSGTFDSFKSLVLADSPLSRGAERFEDSNGLSEAVARDPRGIGFIGLAYIRDAKAIAVSEGETPPLLPNRLTVATEDYALARRLFMYTPANSTNEWVRKFVDFALSAKGQEIVGNSGFIAQNVQSETHTASQNAPAKYKELTNGAERLSLNFRFRRGGKELDSKARLDLDRVVTFISDLKYSGQNILLLGFSDDGGGPSSNVDLSLERAQLVARQFKLRGLNPAVVEGFGSEILITSSATAEGKEKNSRVELWLKR